MASLKDLLAQKEALEKEIERTKKQDRGEAIAYSPETLNDITRSAIAALYSGEPIDADVAP